MNDSEEFDQYSVEDLFNKDNSDRSPITQLAPASDDQKKSEYHPYRQKFYREEMVDQNVPHPTENCYIKP
ncbi:MAG: hypothetical protein AAGE84_12390 [Cyanobacteria bacterium P01_G01_bin.39]